MNVEKEERKILIMGLDNAGKTSILLSLQKDTNLLSFCKIRPTQGINISDINDPIKDIHVWDFGGQKQYRKGYIKNFKEHILKSEKIIYVFDVQDKDRYELALNYFKTILEAILKEVSGIKISIFFHKYDSGLEKKNPDLVNIEIPLLKEKIKNIIPSNIQYEFFKTTIFAVLQKEEY